MASKPSWEVIVGLVAIVVLAWVINLLVGFAVDEKGVFGDQFGAVNALFSGLAFSGVVYAILLQRYEVGLLQEELARTKDILEEQKKLAAEQLTGQRKQAFESTFFNLVDLFNSIISGLVISGRSFRSSPVPDLIGRAVLTEYLKHSTPFSYEGALDAPSTLEKRANSHLENFQRYRNELSHYFRVLNNLMTFVDRSDFIDRPFYANVVRAQLSNDEVSLLFLEILSETGAELKLLVEKYGLLKNLDCSNEVVRHLRGRENLAPSAFE